MKDAHDRFSNSMRAMTAHGRLACSRKNETRFADNVAAAILGPRISVGELRCARDVGVDIPRTILQLWID
jgi:hypothetical protein